VGWWLLHGRDRPALCCWAAVVCHTHVPSGSHMLILHIRRDVSDSYVMYYVVVVGSCTAVCSCDLVG
jgi:hypothetical protein